MLDYIGLLEVGNEELARFAWKAFARWQRRLDTTEEEKEEKRKIFHFLKAFRDTFSRPVRRVRFLGLFDTVNSVPHFETAFLQRSKFPYTAKSSALVIRHAVSINERRAKFRQDLVSGSRQESDHSRIKGAEEIKKKIEKKAKEKSQSRSRFRREKKRDKKPSLTVPNGGTFGETRADSRTPLHAKPTEENMSRYRRPSRAAMQHRTSSAGRDRSKSPRRTLDQIMEDSGSVASDLSAPIRGPSAANNGANYDDDDDDADEARAQDIMEVWFPGEHAVRS